MARGKYAEKSAKRQAELAVTSDLASYQHRVAKLTAENRELRERLAAQERTAKHTERRLRAERDEGVAPQVAALKLVTTQLQERLDTTRRDRRDMETVYRRVARRFCVHLVEEHGMDIESARNFLHSFAGQRYDMKISARDIAIIDSEKIDAGRRHQSEGTMLRRGVPRVGH